MKFQPFCSFATILVGLLVAQSTLAEEWMLPEPTCVDVIEAYVNTRKGSEYRELIYQPMKSGKLREYDPASSVVPPDLNGD